MFVCSSTERSVVLYFRWPNENCTLEMLLDKKSDGFKNIEAKLSNEVTLLSQSETSNRTCNLSTCGDLISAPPRIFHFFRKRFLVKHGLKFLVL